MYNPFNTIASMHRRSFLAFGGFLLAGGCAPSSTSTARPRISVPIDAVTQGRIKTLTALFPEQRGRRMRLAAISQSLIGTPYQANRLIGSATHAEEFVVDLRGVDCLSFLEYVVALNKSTSENDFLENLIATRYIQGIVAFSNRRHFLSDWSSSPEVLSTDITRAISPHSVSVTKNLNQKRDGSLYLPGIPIKTRTIHYIPAQYVENALPQLKDGDLIGIYSPLAGLDVSHTGFAIWDGSTLLFRNASSLSAHPYVVDTPLKDYIHNKTGIVVLRLLGS